MGDPSAALLCSAVVGVRHAVLLLSRRGVEPPKGWGQGRAALSRFDVLVYSKHVLAYQGEAGHVVVYQGHQGGGGEQGMGGAWGGNVPSFRKEGGGVLGPEIQAVPT